MRRGTRWVLVGSVGVVLALCFGFLLIVQLVMSSMGGGTVAMTAAVLAAQQDCGGGKGSGVITPIDASKTPGQWNAEQKANAAAIVEQVTADVTKQDQRQAAIVALATAMQESVLANVPYGNADSVGLFQQRTAWGALSARMDPHKSTHMFLTGGQGGQRGLLSVPGWQRMPVWQAAQSVQVSAFPTAYARWTDAATQIADALLGSTPSPSMTPVNLPAPPPVLAPRPSATMQDVALACNGADPVAMNGPVPTTGWGAPLPAGSWVMTSPFGWRFHPVLHRQALHTGDDLAAPYGTPVYAVHDGTVKAAAPNDGYGNQVVVSHGGGVDSAYNHLSAILVKVGQAVKAGQVVGKVGSTGMSTGNHLHFEIRLGGKPIDPVPFMRARGVVLDRK